VSFERLLSPTPTPTGCTGHYLPHTDDCARRLAGHFTAPPLDWRSPFTLNNSTTCLYGTLVGDYDSDVWVMIVAPCLRWDVRCSVRTAPPCLVERLVEPTYHTHVVQVQYTTFCWTTWYYGLRPPGTPDSFDGGDSVLAHGLHTPRPPWAL